LEASGLSGQKELVEVCISRESKAIRSFKRESYNINSPNLLQALTFKKENFLKASVFNHLDLLQD
jgi:hypothetical protein